MSAWRRAVCLLLACAPLLAGCAAAPRESGTIDLAIVDATVIDPRTERLDARQTLLIREGRIVARGAAVHTPVPSGTPRIDASGRSVIPGLWDMHVHTLWDPLVRESFLPLFVAHGVTGVRDMGGTLDVLRQVRREAASAEPPWPRVVAPGPILDGPQPLDPSISVAIEAPASASASAATAAAVERLAQAGVDFIKVYTILSPEAYRAVGVAHGPPASVPGCACTSQPTRAVSSGKDATRIGADASVAFARANGDPTGSGPDSAPAATRATRRWPETVESSRGRARRARAPARSPGTARGSPRCA